MAYIGRPGISPALALLIAQGEVRKEQSILDAGCGTGTDALLLAKWGFRRVIGIDADAEAIAIARRRATRLGLGHRVEFFHLDAEDLPGKLTANSVDVVLHTLVGNNLRGRYRRHYAGLASVMRPAALLLSCIRTDATSENRAPGKTAPIPGMTRYFQTSPSVSTHLAEHPDGNRPPYARIALWVGRRRRNRPS